MTILNILDIFGNVEQDLIADMTLFLNFPLHQMDRKSAATKPAKKYKSMSGRKYKQKIMVCSVVQCIPSMEEQTPHSCDVVIFLITYDMVGT